MVGKDRKTLYRDIKAGKVSATTSETGEKQLDIAELVRVYGELRQPGETARAVAMPHDETAELRQALALSQQEASSLRERLRDKESHIEDLRKSVRLLAVPTPSPWWKFW